MNKHKWFKWVILGSFLSGIALVVISLFLPPTGVIDPSVIQSVGIIFTFASIFEALLSDKIVRLSFKFGELYVGDKNKEVNDVDDEQKIR